jgi:hypothetical protein
MIRFLIGWFIVSVILALFFGRLFAIQKEGDRTALHRDDLPQKKIEQP